MPCSAMEQPERIGRCRQGGLVPHSRARLRVVDPAEGLANLDDFEYVWLIWVFDQVCG